MNNFADRLIDAIKEKGSCVCVGLDPRLEMMPQEIIQRFEHFKSWNSTEYAGCSIGEFGKQVIDIVVDYAVAVKPQSAFYELYGHDGIQALEQTVSYASTKGLIVILDVKRSDIASTAEAYAAAYLKNSSADAITLNPFLGEDSLEPFVKECLATGKGAFVLVKTSNKGSKDLQDRLVDKGKHLYDIVAEQVVKLGAGLIGKNGYSSFGAVVGATFPDEAKRLRARMPHQFLLVPGYGAQGATAQDLKGYFNPDGLGAIINASRSVIYAYGKPDAQNWREKIKQAVQEMRKEINTGIFPS
ncbi:MAG: orotidine-5'-phosphate decarboxylase [Planctomycetes bacterium]|nr:orotidine-5'-phosphate decarboxylase [Planctomycetota bacterium]